MGNRLTRITGDVIEDLTIESRHLADGAVTSDKIGSGEIHSEHIGSGEIESHHIASGAVTSDKIATGAVQSRHIADGAITSEKIGSGEIHAENIGSGEIHSEHLGEGCILAEHISEIARNSIAVSPEPEYLEHRENVPIYPGETILSGEFGYIEEEYEYSSGMLKTNANPASGYWHPSPTYTHQSTLCHLSDNDYAMLIFQGGVRGVDSLRGLIGIVRVEEGETFPVTPLLEFSTSNYTRVLGMRAVALDESHVLSVWTNDSSDLESVARTLYAQIHEVAQNSFGEYALAFTDGEIVSADIKVSPASYKGRTPGGENSLVILDSTKALSVHRLYSNNALAARIISISGDSISAVSSSSTLVAGSYGAIISNGFRLSANRVVLFYTVYDASKTPNYRYIMSLIDISESNLITVVYSVEIGSDASGYQRLSVCEHSSMKFVIQLGQGFAMRIVFLEITAYTGSVFTVLMSSEKGVPCFTDGSICRLSDEKVLISGESISVLIAIARDPNNPESFTERNASILQEASLGLQAISCYHGDGCINTKEGEILAVGSMIDESSNKHPKLTVVREYRGIPRSVKKFKGGVIADKINPVIVSASTLSTLDMGNGRVIVATNVVSVGRVYLSLFDGSYLATTDEYQDLTTVEVSHVHLAKIDSMRFIACFTEGSSPYYGKAKVFTLHGNSLSAGGTTYIPISSRMTRLYASVISPSRVLLCGSLYESSPLTWKGFLNYVSLNNETVTSLWTQNPLGATTYEYLAPVHPIHLCDIGKVIIARSTENENLIQCIPLNDSAYDSGGVLSLGSASIISCCVMSRNTILVEVQTATSSPSGYRISLLLIEVSGTTLEIVGTLPVDYTSVSVVSLRYFLLRNLEVNLATYYDDRRGSLIGIFYNGSSLSRVKIADIGYVDSYACKLSEYVSNIGKYILLQYASGYGRISIEYTRRDADLIVISQEEDEASVIYLATSPAIGALNLDQDSHYYISRDGYPVKTRYDLPTSGETRIEPIKYLGYVDTEGILRLGYGSASSR